MYKVQRLRRCFLKRGLKFDIGILYSKYFSSISQTNGDKHDLEQTIFTPTKWEIRRAEKLFYSIGPKTVLHESALKCNNFTKLKQLPEVAFLGRTSVGKSSLINAILHQKKLAKISRTPGHTKLINYFNVGSKFYLVDLPGYGYVEGQGGDGQHFVKIVENYLKARANRQLRSICLLIDGKVGIKNNDLIAVEMLEEMNAPFHIAVTKMDRVNKEAHDLINKQIKKEIQRLSSLFFPHVFLVSSKEKTGLSKLRCFIGLCTGILK